MSDNRIVSRRPAFARFLAAHPEYAATDALDELRAYRVRPARRRAARLPRLHRRRPVRRVAGARARGAAERSACSATRIRRASCSTATTDLVEQTRRAVLRLLQRAARRVHRGLHGQRHRRAQAGRRVVSVRAGRPLPADRSTTTTRSTASASSRAPKARRRLRADHRARPAHRSSERLDALLDAGGPRRAPTSSRFPRSRTSPACSTRST